MASSKQLIQAAAGVSTGPEGAWDLSYAYYDPPENSLWNVSSASFVRRYYFYTQTREVQSVFFKPDGTTMYVVGNNQNNVNEYDLSTAWDVSTATFTQSFSIYTQERDATGLFFKPDGTKMYITGFYADSVQEYDLSTAWDISTASHNQSFSVSSQDTSPQGVSFKPDGSKMYVVGQSSTNVSEYNLSTSWDISTASYSQNFSVSSQDSGPTDLFFKSDGTTMYIVGDTTNAIYQYNLGTAWDVSTASYKEEFSLAATETIPKGMYIKPDGTRMYVVGQSGDDVSEYVLGGFSVVAKTGTDSTGFFFKDDGSKMYVLGQTGSPADAVHEYSASAGFDVSAQDTFPVDLAVSSNGTKIYVLGGTNVIYQYSLSTAYDLTTASYDSVSFNTSSQATNTYGITFNSDGTKFYAVDYAGSTVYQYSLSTAHDLSTASYDSVGINLSSQDIYPFSIAFKNDGTKMYMVGLANDTVYQYSLSTAYDISTASYDSVSFSPISQDNDPRDLAISSDGTKMYINGYQTEGIYEYDLSTAFDVSTASYSGSSLDKSSEDTNVLGMSLSSDGTKIYIVGFTNDKVYQYNLSTAYDISTAVLSVPESLFFDLSSFVFSQSFSVAAQENAPTAVFFKSDGTKMYVIGTTGDDVNEYNLSTAWDVSTSTYSQNFSFAAQETNPRGIYFKDDGTKMYISGVSSNAVNEYNLSTAWDVTTASYSQNFSVNTQDTNNRGLFFKPDGSKMYIGGTTGDAVYEYDLSTSWDVSSASYVQNFSVADQETNPQAVFFHPDGTQMFVTGQATEAVYTYSIGVQE